MDFSLDENQKAFLKLAQAFVKKLDLQNGFSPELTKKAWEAGFLSMSIPEEQGGLALDPLTIALIIEEIAYGCGGLAVAIRVSSMANEAIAAYGNEAQKEKYLTPFTQKPMLASFCVTEAEAGSDIPAMSTFIKKRDDGKYVLNGTKLFITNANYAEQFIVFCKLSDPRSQFLACVVVPKDPKEGKIEVGAPSGELDRHFLNMTDVTFKDVVVDPSEIIGDRRCGFNYFLDALDFSRTMMAAVGCGVARKAYDLTLHYTKSRVQFGQRICDLPVARETLVKMFNKAKTAYVATMHAAWKLKNRDRDKAVYAAMAKNLAAEAAVFNGKEGLHLHGGYGFMREYEIARLVLEGHFIDIGEGTREILSMNEGRELVNVHQ
jgi:acyl-CoA dehydrogenase